MPREQARQPVGAELGLGARIGLEPATYGLEVRQSLSAWCCGGASPQVGSGRPSDRLHPGRSRYSDPDCQRDCQCHHRLPSVSGAAGRLGGRRDVRTPGRPATRPHRHRARSNPHSQSGPPSQLTGWRRNRRYPWPANPVSRRSHISIPDSWHAAAAAGPAPPYAYPRVHNTVTNHNLAAV
jgi:hypothetical protein